MKEGRELDAIVAETVFGYRLKKQHGNCFWVDVDGIEPDHSTEFSTDIAAAWEVVEKLRSSFFIHLEYQPHYGWTCLITMGEVAVIGEAGKAPLAICLAALKAMEETNVAKT